MTTIQQTKPKLKTSAMIASIAAEGQATTQAPFGHALNKVAETDKRIVGLTADLAKYTDLHIFAQKYPERFFQMGMAEQLLFGAAGGMAKEGLIPFVTTYAVFATRRAYDFIHQIIGEEHLNVKICCALPGLTTGYGPSHQATEDLALMRTIPGLTIIDPCDALETEQAVQAMVEYDGPVYMRLLRGSVPSVLDEYGYQFELGKAKVITDESDVLIISTGILTMRALEVYKELKKEGIGVRVLHVPTIKPLDETTILNEIKDFTGPIVVAENHTTIGGLGEIISDLMVRNQVFKAVTKIALPDAYLDAGALPTLHDRYGISTEKIIEKIKNILN
ncbi:1-deoxy-D-xylulose-5-phosphate synthase [Oligella ureolytica]|uniref:transketolase family protein n=1 Tax=Oligella ureolytica TaxID=90244 RepID=UPI000DFCCE80|nr:transketolase C-terminal domain-containing protein [Oligella ureolytica]SUA59127.1 1-deoxy-D-xylulose-5-phosphate synthase [Oligella ureolytica]